MKIDLFNALWNGDLSAVESVDDQSLLSASYTCGTSPLFDGPWFDLFLSENVPNTPYRIFRTSAKHFDESYGGVSPLMIAAYRGHEKLLQCLLTRGATVHQRDDLGMDAFVYAILGDHKPCVTALLEHGANVSAELDCTWLLEEDLNFHHATPLAIACLSQKSKVLPVLLNAEANLPPERRTPVDLAYFYALLGKSLTAMQTLHESGVPIPITLSEDQFGARIDVGRYFIIADEQRHALGQHLLLYPLADTLLAVRLGQILPVCPIDNLVKRGGCKLLLDLFRNEVRRLAVSGCNPGKATSPLLNEVLEHLTGFVQYTLDVKDVHELITSQQLEEFSMGGAPFASFVANALARILGSQSIRFIDSVFDSRMVRNLDTCDREWMLHDLFYLCFRDRIPVARFVMHLGYPQLPVHLCTDRLLMAGLASDEDFRAFLRCCPSPAIMRRHMPSPFLRADHAKEEDTRRLVNNLILAGYALNDTDEKGRPLIMVAMRYNKVGLAKVLIEAGAPVDWVDPMFGTITAFAKKRGWVDLLEVLRARGLPT